MLFLVIIFEEQKKQQTEIEEMFWDGLKAEVINFVISLPFILGNFCLHIF